MSFEGCERPSGNVCSARKRANYCVALPVRHAGEGEVSMKLPNQAQAILRQDTLAVVVPKGVRPAGPSCAASCSQLDPTAREICLRACGQ